MRALSPALVAASLVACSASGNHPAPQILPGMVESIPYDTFEPNPVLHGGRTLQAPPEGSIARGWQPLHYAAGREEALRAGAQLHNPLLPSTYNLARGELMYATFCAVCHGPQADGDGPVAAVFPGPPPLKTPSIRGMGDGQIFHIITFGGTLMPAHAVQILPVDRWRIVLHLRRLQGAGNAP